MAFVRGWPWAVGWTGGWVGVWARLGTNHSCSSVSHKGMFAARRVALPTQPNSQGQQASCTCALMLACVHVGCLCSKPTEWGSVLHLFGVQKHCGGAMSNEGQHKSSYLHPRVQAVAAAAAAAAMAATAAAYSSTVPAAGAPQVSSCTCQLPHTMQQQQQYHVCHATSTHSHHPAYPLPQHPPHLPTCTNHRQHQHPATVTLTQTPPSLPSPPKGVLTSRPTARDIKIDGFSLGMCGNELIQDCSIELTIGRRYGLIGQNGCGKTSFLQVGCCGGGAFQGCRVLEP